VAGDGSSAGRLSSGASESSFRGPIRAILRLALIRAPDHSRFSDAPRRRGARIAVPRNVVRSATLIGKAAGMRIAGRRRASGNDDEKDDDDEEAPRSPSQQRNIEAVVHTRVIDRTQLILDILRGTRARGKVSCRWNWRNWNTCFHDWRGGREMSQLGGGIGTRGPGETQLRDRREDLPAGRM